MIKTSKRLKADAIKPFRCRTVIAVLENPKEMVNIGSVVRNVCALGVDKTYIVDPRKSLPDDWQEMRTRSALMSTSVSAIKWSYVRRFDSTEDCLAHLARKHFQSVVTSPHIKGKNNVLLHEGDYTKFSKIAVWFGNESQGISDVAVEASKLCINIPMYGMIESLNLGTTTGIVLHEITKQRREYSRKAQSETVLAPDRKEGGE